MSYITASDTLRDRDRYEINALTKGLRVLVALEDGRPATLTRITERTRLDMNYCYRALCTLELAGFARTSEAGWQLTGRGTRAIAEAA